MGVSTIYGTALRITDFSVGKVTDGSGELWLLWPGKRAYQHAI